MHSTSYKTLFYPKDKSLLHSSTLRTRRARPGLSAHATLREALVGLREDRDVLLYSLQHGARTRTAQVQARVPRGGPGPPSGLGLDLEQGSGSGCHRPGRDRDRDGTGPASPLPAVPTGMPVPVPGVWGSRIPSQPISPDRCGTLSPGCLCPPPALWQGQLGDKLVPVSLCWSDG